MTGTQVFAIAFVVMWLTCAVGLGVVMQRRGYSGFGWGVIGAVLGPLGLLLALLAEKPTPPDRWEQSGLAAGGPVDVLVGVDGSSASVDAAAAALDLLGDRLGRVTLATVAPFDANAENEARAEEALAAAGHDLAAHLRVAQVIAGKVVLHGRPADALADRARAGGYDVIVVGSHGHGASAAILGRVTAALVERADVPLLVLGRRRADPDAEPSGALPPIQERSRT